jgi:pimeloyl-ACP methyl ester carboxylesterase
MAAAAFTPLSDLAAERGLRTVTYSRPGYGQSTPQPDRTVAHAVGDVAAVMDALSADHFYGVGWSMGGPHALACAALLPERCEAVVTIASIAPYGVEGLDWLAGMMEINIEEYTLALQGASALTPLLEKWAKDLATLQPADVGKALSQREDLDAARLAGFREFVAAGHSRSVSAGVAGWRDDDLACLRPWGFDLAAIKCPTSLWHGGKDVHAPYSHVHSRFGT